MPVEPGYADARMAGTWVAGGPNGPDYMERLRDFDGRIDRMMRAAAEGDSRGWMRTVSGLNHVGDDLVMSEALGRRRDAGAPDPKGLLEYCDRVGVLKTIPDDQMADVARKMRDATASRGDDAGHFLRHQRHFVTREDLAAALSTPEGRTHPTNPIATLLANAGDLVAFHVPARPAKGDLPATGAVTHKGPDALRLLHDGFGERSGLRSLDVRNNAVAEINQRRGGKVLGDEVTEDCIKGVDALQMRTLATVVADHKRSLDRAKPKAADGPSR